MIDTGIIIHNNIITQLTIPHAANTIPTKTDSKITNDGILIINVPDDINLVLFMNVNDWLATPDSPNM